MSSQPPDRSLLNRAFRIIMVEGVLIAALAMAVAYLLLLRPPQNVEQALLDPGIRRAALQMLVEDSKAQGLMDTFPDPDVGRVLLPAQKRTLPDGRQMRTNLYGMRERDYPLPKPAGTTRVVLLGDSFIFGLGLDQADRACSAFGREATRRGVPPPTVNLFGSPFITWRGIPLVPTNKLAVDKEGKTSILLLRVGESQQGVVGLQKAGVAGELEPGLSVRYMGTNDHGIASHLITRYFSTAVLTNDAIARLDNVSTKFYHEYVYPKG